MYIKCIYYITQVSNTPDWVIWCYGEHTTVISLSSWRWWLVINDILGTHMCTDRCVMIPLCHLLTIVHSLRLVLSNQQENVPVSLTYHYSLIENVKYIKTICVLLCSPWRFMKMNNIKLIIFHRVMLYPMHFATLLIVWSITI